MPKPLDDLFNVVVDDPDVKAAVKALALEAVQVAREQLGPHMAPQVRAAAMRSVLPALIRSLDRERDNGADDDLRKQVVGLFEEVRGK